MKFYRRDGIFKAYPMTFEEYQRRCDRDPSLPTYDFAKPNDPGYLVEDYHAVCTANHKDYDGLASWYPEHLFKAAFTPQEDAALVTFKHITGDQVLIGVQLNLNAPDEELYRCVYALGRGRFTPLYVRRGFGTLRVQAIRYHPEDHPVPITITMHIPLTDDVIRGGAWLLCDPEDDTLRLKSSTALFRHYDKISRAVGDCGLLSAPNNEESK